MEISYDMAGGITIDHQDSLSVQCHSLFCVVSWVSKGMERVLSHGIKAIKSFFSLFISQKYFSVFFLEFSAHL